MSTYSCALVRFQVITVSPARGFARSGRQLPTRVNLRATTARRRRRRRSSSLCSSEHESKKEALGTRSMRLFPLIRGQFSPLGQPEVDPIRPGGRPHPSRRARSLAREIATYSLTCCPPDILSPLQGPHSGQNRPEWRLCARFGASAPKLGRKSCHPTLGKMPPTMGHRRRPGHPSPAAGPLNAREQFWAPNNPTRAVAALLGSMPRSTLTLTSANISLSELRARPQPHPSPLSSSRSYRRTSMTSSTRPAPTGPPRGPTGRERHTTRTGPTSPLGPPSTTSTRCRPTRRWWRSI